MTSQNSYHGFFIQLFFHIRADAKAYFVLETHTHRLWPAAVATATAVSCWHRLSWEHWRHRSHALTMSTHCLDCRCLQSPVAVHRQTIASRTRTGPGEKVYSILWITYINLHTISQFWEKLPWDSTLLKYLKIHSVYYHIQPIWLQDQWTRMYVYYCA